MEVAITTLQFHVSGNAPPLFSDTRPEDTFIQDIKRLKSHVEHLHPRMPDSTTKRCTKAALICIPPALGQPFRVHETHKNSSKIHETDYVVLIIQAFSRDIAVICKNICKMDVKTGLENRQK